MEGDELTTNEGVLVLVGSLKNPGVSDEDKAAIVAQAVAIQRSNLDEALEGQATWYAWWSALWETARSKEAQLKAAYGEAKADTLRLLLAGGKSAAAAGAIADAEEPVVAAQHEYQQQAAYVGTLRAVVSAFEHRKDMLVQLSANQRQEKSLYS